MKAQRPGKERDQRQRVRVSDVVTPVVAGDSQALKGKFCRLTEPTCKCKEHASRFEEVVSSFAFTSTRSQQTQRPQYHEGQTEDGDGCSRDVVLWKERHPRVLAL